MRIGIDASTWTLRRGYGRFTRELVGAMVKGHPEHDYVLVVDQQTAAEGVFPDRVELEVARTREQQTQAASADGSRGVLDLWRMGRAAAAAACDVFFFPTRYSYFPYPGGTPAVVAFHDATAELHPELIFPTRRSRLLWGLKTRMALRRADRLVTVSEDARRQIAAVFRLDPKEIAVISEGPDPMFQPITDRARTASIRERLKLPRDLPLVLYVGGISPHKNLPSLVRALASVSHPWHAVLVGEYEKDSFFSGYEEVVELCRELGVTERVTLTGFVADEDLLLLYNEASLFVLPSRSEGFGLPVVEAMACGLPVAASNRSSIPEVLGDAGLLFEPDATQEIASAVTRLLADDELREQCRQRGLERARLFTWERGARQLVTLFESLGGR